MTVFDDRKVKEALKKKGFKNEPNKHHNYFYLYVNGKRTSINTHTSRNKQDIGDHLIKKMSGQLYLDRTQFENLIKCPLKHPEYVKILKDKNVLD